MNFLHYFLFHWLFLWLFQRFLREGWLLTFYDGFKILPLCSNCSLPQRLDPNLRSSLIHQRLIPDSIDSKKIGEIQYALRPVRVMGGTGALSDSRTACKEVLPLGQDIDGLQFWVKVLDEPIDPNIITVVLLPDNLPHLLQEFNRGVVEIHEVTTQEGHPHQSQGKHPLFLLHPVLEAVVLRVLEESHRVGHNRTNTPHGILPPDLEPPLKFLAIHDHIIIYIEENQFPALLGDLIAPVHGVAGCLVEVDRSLPFVPLKFDGGALGLNLVVPDDVELSSHRAVQGSVMMDVLLDLSVVVPSSVSDRHEAETGQQEGYVVGGSQNSEEVAVGRIGRMRRSRRRGKLSNLILSEMILKIPGKIRNSSWQDPSHQGGIYVRKRGDYNSPSHLIIFLLCPMLVDPRPYTYEYRKPRYANPTFQSRNLYDSLYHRHSQQRNDYYPESDARILTRNFSEVKSRPQKQEQSPLTDRNPERYDSGFKLPSLRNERAGVPSNMGSMNPSLSRPEGVAQRKEGFEQFRIYHRQQLPYNIISCYPKEEDNNQLRNFPKLTLENRLLERGSYHNFKEEKF